MKKQKIFYGFLIISFLFSAAGLHAQANRGNQLRNISVFHEFNAYREKGADAPMFCTVWGNFDLENGSLPLDTSVRNGRKKVYRVNARGRGGIMFPFHGWGSFTLEQYYENGVIEFDIRGASGAEDFTIGFRSGSRGVEKTHTVSLTSQNIQVTRNWQRVRIPLKNIVPDIRDGFSIQSVFLVLVEIPGPMQFYLSDMYITSPDREKQYPVIKVNQLGYTVNHEKYALVSSFPGTLALSANTEFSVINANGETAFSGRLQPVTRRTDTASGENVFRADFSPLNIPGAYHIRISNPQIDNSFRFIIGNNIYNNLLNDTIKYFYFQRQGIDLEQRYAGVFARKNLHPGDNRVKKYSQRNVATAPVFDISRGWYDAGDFGKYFPSAASTVTDLLFAYELFPNLFRDNQLNIPESNNGAPDLLDEIKWELDMMLRLEDGTTGGFFEVANYEGETIFIVDTDGVTGAGNTKSTVATGWAAGVFAHAYIVYKDIPLYRNFASQCLDAAKRAWAYLEARPGEHTWVSGAGRSYYYDASETLKARFLAAAALYRATNEEKYQNYVIQNYRSFNYDREFNAYHVVTIGEIGTAFIHYAMTPSPNDAVMNFFQARFSTFETGVLRYYNENAWPTAIPNWAYFWGSTQPIVRIPAELYMCYRVLNKDVNQAVKMLRDSVHYVLGINPLSFSFISGYGENSVINIYSGIFSHDGIDEIPRGYVAGGANQYDAGFLSNYPAKAYVDSDREWTTNEHAIYWNAAMVLNLTILAGTIDINVR